MNDPLDPLLNSATPFETFFFFEKYQKKKNLILFSMKELNARQSFEKFFVMFKMKLFFLLENMYYILHLLAFKWSVAKVYSSAIEIENLQLSLIWDEIDISETYFWYTND